MSFKISRKAEEDLEQIWLYTYENWSRAQADRYIRLIFDEINFLAKNPANGKDFSHVRKNYRCAKVKSHLIFYKHTPPKTIIEVIRVLHERMDIENRINK